MDRGLQKDSLYNEALVLRAYYGVRIRFFTTPEGCFREEMRKKFAKQSPHPTGVSNTRKSWSITLEI